MSYRGLGDEEKRLSTLILQHLARWLKRVADAVLAGFQRFRISPDPTAVYSRSVEWEGIVEKNILPELWPSARIGWNEVLPDSDSSLVSTDTYVQASLAMSRNLLVRISDDVYNLVFAEITDAVNDGDGTREMAARIQRVLDVTASEQWPNRATTIAVTEVNRAANAGALAAGHQAERDEGVPMLKRWIDSDDRRVRPAHRDADGQTMPLNQPFRVGGSLLMCPGDPTGLPEDVIACRCSIQILERRR